MPKRIVLFLIGVGFFFFFIFFSYLVHKDLFKQADFDTTVRLQNNISHRFDDGFSLLSDIGKFEVMTVILFIVAGYLVFRKKFLAAISVIGLYVGFHLIELYGKFFVDHPPPPQFMLRTKDMVAFPEFHVRSEFSYPSGHAGRAAFLSVILLTLILGNKKLSLPLKVMLSAAILGYDLTMFVSRVYLGEHWSTDVFGGAVLGTGLGLVTAMFLVGKQTLKNLVPKFKVEIKRVE